MATKAPEAEARLFKDKFVCKDCKSVVRATNLRVLSGRVRCRKCSSSSLRPKKRK
ncbi:MAG: 50S ribosomal protein L40e [Candidatus Woesearchaeota archaeon]|nr:MAG: 50S ribosomal protein L40e [Candidatus Woesearchaeota archaeon]